MLPEFPENRVAVDARARAGKFMVGLISSRENVE
jgi:hypothetical protein